MTPPRSRDEILMATLPRAQRKALGQFATPDEIAALMAAWIDQPGIAEVVDPAVGTGALLRAIAARHGGQARVHLRGGELDPAAAAIATAELGVFAGAGSSVEIGDFFERALESWAAISCNPPYLNAARLANREALRQCVERDAGIAFRGNPNLALLFSARLLAFLAPGGRLALLIPSELLDQRTAGPFKRALLDRGLLRAVITFDDEQESVFEGVETTATVLLLERPALNEETLPNEIGLIRVEHDGVAAALHAITGATWPVTIAATLLQDYADGRWSRVFADQHSDAPGAADVRLGDLLEITSPRNSGWDAFFIRPLREWRSLGIPKRYLAPVIAWKGLMPEDGVLDADWIREMDRRGEAIWLLVAPRDLTGADPALTRLIAAAEASGEMPKTLRGKAGWWAQRPTDPAPLYAVSYWHPSSHFAILRNTAGIAGFASFFALRPRDLADGARIAGDPAVAEAFIGARRRLGHGLSKIEVSDARTAIVRGWRRASIESA